MGRLGTKFRVGEVISLNFGCFRLWFVIRQIIFLTFFVFFSFFPTNIIFESVWSILLGFVWERLPRSLLTAFRCWAAVWTTHLKLVFEIFPTYFSFFKTLKIVLVDVLYSILSTSLIFYFFSILTRVSETHLQNLFSTSYGFIVLKLLGDYYIFSFFFHLLMFAWAARQSWIRVRAAISRTFDCVSILTRVSEIHFFNFFDIFPTFFYISFVEIIWDNL